MADRIKISFVIDCAPGSPRPDVYARKVFDYLGIEYINPISKFFGAWTWCVEISESKYEDFSDWMQETMDDLYKRGHIRGAQWNKE